MDVVCCKLVQSPAAMQPAGGRYVQSKGKDMRPLMKPSLLVNLQENPAGLITDLAILALLLILLAVR
jgi:hypothetical protein